MASFEQQRPPITGLVTGASAGIGREIARVPARDVATLILVACRRERLDELAAELTSKRVELRVLVDAVDSLDRQASVVLFDELEERGEEVEFLVSNTGFVARVMATVTASLPWAFVRPIIANVVRKLRGSR